MPFRRDEKEIREEIMLAYTKRAVPADQDKRAAEEIVAPRQIPSLPKTHCKRPNWDTTNNANLPETLRYVVRRRSSEMGTPRRNEGIMYRKRVVKRTRLRNFGEATNQKQFFLT